MPKNQLTRREFIQTSTATTAALVLGDGKRAVAANDKLNLGFIGVGGRGTSLLKYATRIPDFNIVSICDLRPERRERGIAIAEEEDHKPTGYADFLKMYETERLDAVVVATEPANHGKCVIPALERGLNCFSEKPMDTTVEKVDALVRAARKAKGVYQVGFQRRYNPTFLTTIALAHSETFGRVTFLQGHWHFGGKPGGWVLDVDISGGRLVEQACHHLDIMTWVMKGHPLTCNAMGAATVPRTAPPVHKSEDHSSLNFEFEGGVILSYTHFSCMPGVMQGEKLWAFKEEAVIDMAQGMRHSIYVKGDERIAEATSYSQGEREQLECFARHIRNGETPNSNVETARISTLTALMGRKAMYNREKGQFEPSQITWKDVGTTTDLA